MTCTTLEEELGGNKVRNHKLYFRLWGLDFSVENTLPVDIRKERVGLDFLGV